MEKQNSKRANEIINNHVWFATVPGFLPVVVLDVLGITAIQLDMIKQLCNLYEREYSHQKGKALVTSLTGSIMGRIPGYTLRSVLKSIPVVGWVLGGLSLSASAGVTTYALGQVFKEHLDSDGTLHNLDINSFKKFYVEQLEKGLELLKMKGLPM